MDYIINKAIYDYGDIKHCLDIEKNINEGHGHDFEFLGLRSLQLNIEPTKASTGSYIELPPDLKSSKSILKIRNCKYNCLQIVITAWLHPTKNHATRESNYAKNLNVPRLQHEIDFAYVIRMQKLYNINRCLYTPCGNSIVEPFKPALKK